MQATLQKPEAKQQPIWAKPPQAITTKDLNYLKDALSWELLAFKKCAHFAKEVKSTEIKELITQIGQMHQRHYKLLLQHLQTDNQRIITDNAKLQAQQSQS